MAGKIAASLCRCLVKIKPEIGVSAFVPHACDIIDDLLTEDMIDQQQLIDEELDMYIDMKNMEEMDEMDALNSEESRKKPRVYMIGYFY